MSSADRKTRAVSQAHLDKAERYVEEDEGTSRRRLNLRFWGTIITVVAVVMSLFHLYSAYAIVLPLVLRGIHVGGVLALVFLVFPAMTRLRGRAIWFDVALAMLALACIGHMLVDFNAFIGRAIFPTNADLFFGVALVLLVLEAVRRTIGLVMFCVIAASLAYAFLGPWLPQPWTHQGYDLVRLVGHLYMTTNGIFGSAVDVSSSYIILFCIFGAVLKQSGAGKFFIDFAFALMGRRTSGAGKAVTLSSFLLGGPSGSSTATTVMMGSVAYPMLARAGYGKNTAGGLLAAGGIGAIMSPPVMGAAAFLIAEFLGISYFDVMIMAAIPTVLFYSSLLMLVSIDARKFGMPDRVVEGIPPAWTSAKRHGFHFASLIAIVAFMALGFTPIAAVLWATIIATVLSFCNREDALYPARLVAALKAGTIDVLGVAATCAGAGVIIGVVTLTGLGLKFSSIIVGYAGNSVFLTALYTALVVWVIGLAVPVTASYIICAVITAPALISVGVPDFAAHLFIFYYAVLAEVSPPTAMAPFAAAAITGGGPYRTTMLTWKYTLPVFIVPFIFVLEPAGVGLLMKGGIEQIVVVTLAALFGILALGVALQNWLVGPASLPERAGFAVGGAVLLYPSVATYEIGAVIVATVLTVHVVRNRRGAYAKETAR